MAKAIGSDKARKQVIRMTRRVLRHKNAHKMTPTEAALVLHLTVNDVRNMRQGNKLSVPMICRMVRDGRFDPNSIFNGPELVKLRGRASTPNGAYQDLVDDRIRKLAWGWPGKALAKVTGLSVTGAYGLRYATRAHVTLYTVIGFVNAGYTVDALVLGK